MYALSGKDPWWSLIAWEEKRLETRSWAPWSHLPVIEGDVPFLLALHISATLDPADREMCLAEPFADALERHGVTFRRRARDYQGAESYDPIGLLPTGHVVAVCQVRAIVRMTGPAIPRPLVGICQDTFPGWNAEQERAFGYYAKDRFAWLLTNVRRLPTGVPAKGRLGLWEWTPPAEIAAWLAEGGTVGA
jgi:activating signal cointegrator 1